MKRRILWLVLLFAAGIALSRLGVTAIFHEFSHIAAAVLTGGYGYMDSWSSCVIRGGNRAFVAAAGYTGEMLFYLALFGIGMIWRRRARNMIWFGAAHDTYIWTATVPDADDFGMLGAGALVAFVVIFFVLLVAAWILFIGTEALCQSKGGERPVRWSLEDIRKRWG